MVPDIVVTLTVTLPGDMSMRCPVSVIVCGFSSTRSLPRLSAVAAGSTFGS